MSRAVYWWSSLSWMRGTSASEGAGKLSMTKSSKTEKSEDRVLPDSEKTSSQAQAQLDPAIQGVLGRKLKESYEALVNEEVPSKFMDLLEQLKKKESSSPKDGT